MERSPAGRHIEELEGDGATITRRGRRIESIGRQMVQSADVLQDLVDGDAQRGKAIEKIREIVGDTYVELRRAGEMYEPTGPVLVDYGRAVSEVQPLIRTAVSACRQAWADYASAPHHPTALLSLEAFPDLAESRQEDNERKEELYDDWVLEARAFDRHYDTWEDAFDAAVTGIGDVLDGAIKDSLWDNVDGVVAVVLEVLGWVSLVIAIAGIIIGGPLFALIGAVLGVVTLLLTAYQVLREDAGADKLIIAIIGVIPFGKVGKLFQGRAGMLSFGGEMVTAFRPSAWSAAGGQLRNMSILSRFAGGGLNGASAAFRGLWSMNNPAGAGDIMCRFMFGRNSAGLTDLAETVGGSINGWCTSSTLSAAWEGGYMMVSGAWGVGDKIATWTGNKDQKPSSMFPWVGALL